MKPKHVSEPFRWAPAIVIAILAWLNLFPIVSVDVDYHLATGRRILDERGIPTRGVGSATFGQEPWHDQEWGFQVLAALIGEAERDAAGVWVLTQRGIVGLILLRALCLAATLALLSAQMARAGVGSLTRAVALVLAGFLTFGNLFWAVRPQILSYLLLAAVGYLLQRDETGDSRAAWLTLGVVALWSNLHGAFVIGIALLGAEALGASIDAWRSRGHAGRARRLWIVTALSPLAACLNPHGYRQVVHPFLYLLEPEIYAGNAEWSRPDFLHLPLFVLTLVVLGVVLLARHRVGAAEVLRCVVFTGLLLSAVRHLPLAAIVLVPVLARSVSEAAGQGGWRGNLEPTGTRWGLPWARAAAALALTAAIVGLSGAFTRSTARFVTLVPKFALGPIQPMPENAVRYLAGHGVEGSIFNTYRFGGFLMFRLYPREQVFMDGRNDLYGTFRNEVYNRVLQTRSGWRSVWEGVVERYDVGSVLVDEHEPLAAALRDDPAWHPPAPGRIAVTDGRPGQDGVVLLLRDRRPRARGTSRAPDPAASGSLAP